MRHVKLTLLLLTFAVPGIAAFAQTNAAQPAAIGLWERFEASVTNPRSYADPYEDVRLDVAFTAPGGKEIAFWGFYDGGQTWRFRCLPDLRGVWRYRATFSDGSPGVSGEFRVESSKLPGCSLSAAPIRSGSAATCAPC